MPRFILNDENVMNSYGFKIKTAGIDLKRFEANPVMLDGHNPSNLSVIGKWTEIKAENGKLSADTDFDMEDENAKTIAGKVERGVIKGASMGISFSKKFFLSKWRADFRKMQSARGIYCCYSKQCGSIKTDDGWRGNL